jgi:hypothetical protein
MGSAAEFAIGISGLSLRGEDSRRVVIGFFITTAEYD